MGKLQKKKDPRKKKSRLAESPQNNGSSTPSAAQKSTRSMIRGGGLTAVRGKKVPADSASPVKSGKKPSAAGGKKYFEEGLQFLREVRIELKKVTWPSRRQTAGSTAVVLVLVIIVSFFLGIVDFALSSLVKVVLG